MRAEDAIFEGEALAYNPLSDEYLPFQETVRRRRKHGVEAAAQTLPLRLFAFDVLYVDGEDVTPLAYQVRRERLKGLVVPGEVIVLTPVEVLNEPWELAAFFDGAVQNGLEGVVAKRLDAPYRAGSRNYSWVKLKRVGGGSLQDTVDCVVIGYIYGRGKRAAFGIGALLVAVYDPSEQLGEDVAGCLHLRVSATVGLAVSPRSSSDVHDWKLLQDLTGAAIAWWQGRKEALDGHS